MLRTFLQRIHHQVKNRLAQMESPVVTATPASPKKMGEKRSISDSSPQEKSKRLKQTDTNKLKDYKKRAVAILFGYNGKGYYGLQINPGFPTVEGDVLKVLLDIGLIPQEHHDTVQKMSFQRAARTDKGVSAVGNMLSLKMLVNEEDIVGEINTRLPPQIRVFDIIRTTKSFNCKNWCDARTYLYIMPTFAFSPLGQEPSIEYRVTDEVISSVNSILKRFQGTHNFHNYTSKIKPWEKQAVRYIISFECGRPFIRDGMELVILRVKGQSFMLHQIRKMIGTLIAIQRGAVGVEVIDRSWKHDKADIPKAPGLGLVLEKLHYNGYNTRFCDNVKSKEHAHQRLEWDHLQDKMERFCNEMIFSDIIKTEKEENSMLQWLETLELHTYTSERASDKRKQTSDSEDEITKIGVNKPTDDKPTDDKSTDDKSTDDKPADDKPTNDKSTDDKSTDDKPADDKPTNDKSTDDKPTDDKSTDDKPTDDKPVGEDISVTDDVAIKSMDQTDSNHTCTTNTENIQDVQTEQSSRERDKSINSSSVSSNQNEVSDPVTNQKTTDQGDDISVQKKQKVS